MRDSCGVKKGVDQRTDESVLRWFGHTGRMGWLKRCMLANEWDVIEWVDREQSGMIQ